MSSAIDSLLVLEGDELSINRLADTGAALARWTSHAPLEQLAESLGRPVPARTGGTIVDRLTPRSAEEAATRSLSGIYGTGSFPWHSEGAHWRIPPHYLLLRLEESAESDRPTLLTDFRGLTLDSTSIAELKWHLWVTNGGRGIYLTPLLNDTLVHGREVLRYDVNALAPALESSTRSTEILEAALGSIEPVEVHWTTGYVLVVDNWRWLHGRGEGAGTGSRRVLERVLVE